MYLHVYYVREWWILLPLLSLFTSSGCFRMQLGKHAEALEDFNMAAGLCPSSPVVFYNRALCHQVLGKGAEVGLGVV